MMSIFILLVVAIAISAGIGYGILTLIKAGEVSLAVQRNQVQIEAISNSIRAALRFEGDVALVPVDLTEDGVTPLAVVPGIAPFKDTAYGKPIAYCPVSAEPASGGTRMVENGAETFEVEIVERGGRHYVAAGAPTSPAVTIMRSKGIVAFLISPAPSVEGPVPCSTVEVAEGTVESNVTFIADGGSVTPVFAIPNGSTVQHLAVGFPDATEPDTGELAPLPPRVPSSARRFDSLRDAADFITREGVTEAHVHLPAGATVAPIADLELLASGSPGRILRMSGENETVLWALHPSKTGMVPVEFGGTAFIDGVEFGGTHQDTAPSAAFDIALGASPSGRVFLKDTVTGGIAANGGEIAGAGATVIAPGTTQDAATVAVKGGRVILDSAVQVAAGGGFPAFDIRGGRLEIHGMPSVLLSAPSPLIDVVGNGSVSGETATVEMMVNGSPVQVWPREQSKTETCAVGDDYCTATCPSGGTVISGSCSSPDEQPLSGFGISEDGRTYQCQWSAAAVTAGPTAIAYCR